MTDTLDSLRAEFEALGEQPAAEGAAAPARPELAESPDWAKPLQAYRKTAQDGATERAMSSEWSRQAKERADQAEAEVAKHRDALEHPESALGPDALKAAHAAAQRRHAQSTGFLGAVQQYEAARLVRNLDQPVADADGSLDVIPGQVDPVLSAPLFGRRDVAAAGQMPKAFAKGIGTGVGEAVSGSGRAIEGMGVNLNVFARQQLSVMDRIDSGGVVAPMDDAMGYADMAPAERQAARKQLNEELASSAPPGSGLQAAGKAVREHVGDPIQELVEKTLPIDPDTKDHFLVKSAGMAGGFVPYMVVAALTGVPGVMAVAGAQSYEGTFKQAKEKGASDEDAHRAAAISALTNAGLMAVPVSRWMEGLPGLFQGSMITATAALAKEGIVFTSVMQAQKLLDNIIAKSYFDPERKLSEGLGEDLPEQLLVGALFPAAVHGVHRIPSLLRQKADERAFEAEKNKKEPTLDGSAKPEVPPEEQALRDELALGHAHLAQLSTIRTAEAEEKRQAIQERIKEIEVQLPKPSDDVQNSGGTDSQSADISQHIAVGDEVQWTSAGADQFKELAVVKALSPDGKWAFVEGSNTGVPVAELTKAKTEGRPGAGEEPAKDDLEREVDEHLPEYSAEIDDHLAKVGAIKGLLEEEDVRNIAWHMAGGEDVATAYDRWHDEKYGASEPEAKKTALSPEQPQDRMAPRRIVTPDGSMEVAAKPEIVDLATLKAASGALQPRDRSRKESAANIREIAASLDPEQLMPGRVSDAGAPIVTPDHTVLSGNGRVAAIGQAYRDPALKAQADAYRAALGPDAAGMKEPVLIMRLPQMATAEQQKFADLSNRSRIAAMSATERAQRDAQAAGPEIMGLYQGGSLTSPANAEFLKAFTAKVVSGAERGQFSRDARLTKEGEDRMSAAALAAAYGDSALLSRMLESTDDNIRSVTGALRDAAGAFVRLKEAIRKGEADPQFDISAHVAETARRISDLRERNVKPDEFLAQQDAFNQVDPIVDSLLRAFYNETMTRQLSREKLTDLLDAYAQEAAKHRRDGLIPDETTPRQIVDFAKDRALGADLFSERASAARRDHAGTGRAEQRPATGERRPEPRPEGRAEPRRTDTSGAVDLKGAARLAELKTAFHDLLNAGNPRADWWQRFPKDLTPTHEEREVIIRQAIEAGLLRVSPDGILRRNPAAFPDAGRQTVSDAVRMDRTLRQRERDTGRMLGEAVRKYAAELEAAKGDMAKVDAILKDMAADKTLKPEDARDIQAVTATEREYQRALRDNFRRLVGGTTPKDTWAKALRIDEKALEPLIKDAIDQGLLRENADGRIIRTNLARTLPGFTPLLGDYVPRQPGDAVRQRLEVREAATKNTLVARLTEPAPKGKREGKAAKEARIEAGQKAADRVRYWAEQLEGAIGTDGFDNLYEGLKAATVVRGRPKNRREGAEQFKRKEIEELAHLLGVKPTTKDSLAGILDRIKVRHDDKAKFVDGVEMAAFAEHGQDQRRAFDSLGFYSQALEAAKALKQEKGTPEQMLRMIEGSPGVKKAELEATGLYDFLKSWGREAEASKDAMRGPSSSKPGSSAQAGRSAAEAGKPVSRSQKTVSKSDIVSFLEQNRVEVRESVYGERQDDRSKAVRAELKAIEARVAQIPTRNNPEYDALNERRFVLKNELQDTPTRWDPLTVDPGNKTNRESVLHLPTGEQLPYVVKDASGKVVGTYPNRDAAFEAWKSGAQGVGSGIEPARPREPTFTDSHFPNEPNPVVNLGTSIQKTADAKGAPVGLLDRFQMQWAQNIRDSVRNAYAEEMFGKNAPGYKERIAEARKRWHELTETTTPLSAAAMNALHLNNWDLARATTYVQSAFDNGAGRGTVVQDALEQLKRADPAAMPEIGELATTLRATHPIPFRDLTKAQKAAVGKAIETDRKAGQLKGGVRDEAKIADLGKRIAETDTKAKAIWYGSNLDERLVYDHTINGMVVPKSQRGDNALQKAHDEYNALADQGALLKAELSTAKTATPSHPMVATTDQAMVPAIGRMVRQFVEAGVDHIAITPPDVLIARGEGNASNPEGMRHFYNVILPKAVLKFLQQRDPSVKGWEEKALQSSMDGRTFQHEGLKDHVEGALHASDVNMHAQQMRQLAERVAGIAEKEGVAALDTYDAPKGFERGWDIAVAAAKTEGAKPILFHTFPLTDKVKASVLGEGMPLFAFANYRGRAEDGRRPGETDEQFVSRSGSRGSFGDIAMPTADTRPPQPLRDAVKALSDGTSTLIPKRETLPIDSIEPMQGEVSQKGVLRHLKAGSTEPVTVFRYDGVNWLDDGHHRMWAARMGRGDKTIEANVYEVPTRSYNGPALAPHEINHLVDAWRDLHDALLTSTAKTPTRSAEEARKVLARIQERAGNDLIRLPHEEPSLGDILNTDWGNIHPDQDIPMSRIDYTQKGVKPAIVGDYVSGERERTGKPILKHNPETGRFEVVDGTHRIVSDRLLGKKAISAHVIYNRPWHHRLFGIADRQVRDLTQTLSKELEAYGIEPDAFANEADLRAHLSGAAPAEHRQGQGDQSGKTPNREVTLAARESAARKVMESPEWKAAAEKPADVTRDTSKAKGYGSPEWQGARKYVADGKEIAGFQAAVDHLAKAAADAVPGGVAKDKQAYIVIGYPGAGKSTIGEALSKTYRAARVVGDDAKSIIPEYEGGQNNGGVKRESDQLAAATAAKLAHDGTNLILETSGKPGEVDGRATALRAQGYNVALIHVDVPKAIAMERAVARQKEDGRPVPVSNYDAVTPSEAYAKAQRDGTVDQTARITQDETSGNWRLAEGSAGLQSLGNALEQASGGERRGGRRSGDAGVREGAGQGPELAAFGDHSNPVPIESIPLDGEPPKSGVVRAYHGTTKSFDKFNQGVSLGPHFGTAEQASDIVAHGAGGSTPPRHGPLVETLWPTMGRPLKNARILPVDIELRGSITMRDGAFTQREFRAAIKEAGIDLSPQESRGDLRRALVDRGIDGIWYMNEQEGDGWSLIALRGEGQVKSATSGQDLYSLASRPYTQAFRQALPEWAPRLEAELRRMLPEDVALRLSDRLFHSSGIEQTGYMLPPQAAGDKWLINLALTEGGEPRAFRQMLQTGAHEATHVLRERGLWSEAEWDLLIERAAKVGAPERVHSAYEPVYRDILAERYPHLPEAAREARLQEILDQEAVAKMVEDFVGGKATYGSVVDRLLGRIAKFFEALRNAFHGLGFRTADDVLEQAFGDSARKPVDGGERIEPTFGMAPEMMAIEAYHGSPHDFDAFDLNHIGKGEGAQAFGYGLYFSSVESVARYYRNALANRSASVRIKPADPIITYKGKPVPASIRRVDTGHAGAAENPYRAEQIILGELNAINRITPSFDLDHIIDEAKKTVTNWKQSVEDAKSRKGRFSRFQQFFTRRDGYGLSRKTYIEVGPRIIADAEAIVAAGERMRPDLGYTYPRQGKGRLYQVKLDVEPEQMLAWDKPLAQQPASVRAAFDEVYRQVAQETGYPVALNPKEPASEHYHSLTRALTADHADPRDRGNAGRVKDGAKEASVRLLAAGIKGIRYHDQFSRGKEGEGTHNYVLFDDSLINIVAKDGKPVTAAEKAGVMQDVKALHEPNPERAPSDWTGHGGEELPFGQSSGPEMASFSSWMGGLLGRDKNGGRETGSPGDAAKRPSSSGAESSGITAYHGSARDIDQFSIDHASAQRTYAKGLHFADKTTAATHGDRLYEVTIKAAPGAFIQMGATVASQPKRAKTALQALGFAPHDTVVEAWRAARQAHADPDAADEAFSKALTDAGVPGARYGADHYVVFDDRLVEIVAKDGKPVSKADKAGVLADTQQDAASADGLPTAQPEASVSRPNASTPTLDLTPQARKARAEAMGFDTSKVLYHGTRADFDQFSGVTFVATTPERASIYGHTAGPDLLEEGARAAPSGYAGGRVYPLYIRGKYFDWRNPGDIAKLKAAGAGGELSPEAPGMIGRLLESLSAEGANRGKKRESANRNRQEVLPTATPKAIMMWLHLNHDADVVGWMKRNGYDGFTGREDGVDQFAVFDPSNIRSVNAEFDPAQDGSPLLMAAFKSSTPTDTRSLDAALSHAADALGIMASVGEPKPPRTGKGKTAPADPTRQRILTIANEGGRSLLNSLGEDLTGLAGQHEIEMAKYAFPGTPDPIASGFANYFKDYVARPEDAKAQAPEFTTAFNDFLDAHNPHLLEALERLQQASVDRRDARVASERERAISMYAKAGAEQAAGGSGSGGLPPMDPPGAGAGGANAGPPQPPVPPAKKIPLPAAVRAGVDGYIRNFQPELFSDAALKADPMFAAYKSAAAQEKDIIVHQAEEHWQAWNKEAEDDQLAYIRRVELGQQQPTDHLRNEAFRHRRMLDMAYRLEALYGSKAQYVEEYLPHIYKDPAGVREYFKAMTASLGPKWFQKQRQFELVDQALRAGFELKSTNPEELVTLRLMAGVDFRQRVELLQQLERMGMARRAPGKDEDAQQGLGSSTEPRLTEAEAASLPNAGWTEIIAPNTEKWLLSPDVKALWENAVNAKGLWSNEHVAGSIFRKWMAFKNVFVPLKLSLSAFHPLHVMHINMADGLARGWTQLTRGGDLIGALKSAGGGWNPIGGAIGGAIGSLGGPGGAMFGTYAGGLVGASLRKKGGIEARAAWLKPEGERTAYDQEIVTRMREGGFVPQLSEQLKINAARSLQEAWQKAEYLKTLPLGLRRGIEKFQGPIFEKWIPHLKAASYLSETAALLKRRPDLLDDETQRRIAFRAIAKSVDNRFGEMFYGNLFINRVVKDAGIASFLSLGWNLGFVREFGGGTMETVTRRLYKGTESRQTIRDATNKSAFALIYMATAAMGMGMMSYMMTGETPEGYDYIFPRIGGLNPDGSARRITNMSYLREIPMFQKHVQSANSIPIGAGEMLMNKMMIEPFFELARNRDYWGYDLWSDSNDLYRQSKEFAHHLFQGEFAKAGKTLGETSPVQATKHVLGDQLNPITVAGAKRAAELSGKPFTIGKDAHWYDPTSYDWKGVGESATSKGVGLSMLGFGPAPGYVEKKGYENLINHYYDRYVAPIAKPEEKREVDAEKRYVKSQVALANQRGDAAAAQAAREHGTAAGLKGRDMRAYSVSSPFSVFQFSKLPPNAQADVLAHIPQGTPEEKRVYETYRRKADPKVKFQVPAH